MSSSKLTLMGMYHYDESIFDGITVPEIMDKDTLIKNILIESCEFEVMYADINLLKDVISLWSDKWQRTMTKWSDVLNISYEPLQNYDRTETFTDDTTSTSSDIKSGTETTDSTNSATTSTSLDDDSTSLNQVSAFDTSTMQDDTKVTNTNNSSTSGTNNIDIDSTVTNSENNTNSTTIGNEKTGRVYGNIGVTTSQQMLQAELDISKWNWYEKVTDLFINEFCIQVYI